MRPTYGERFAGSRRGQAGLSGVDTARVAAQLCVAAVSNTGLSIEDISHLVGHANTRVTESVYSKEVRPVLARGAGAVDALFPDSTAMPWKAGLPLPRCQGRTPRL
jgi:hypothetical protein